MNFYRLLSYTFIICVCSLLGSHSIAQSGQFEQRIGVIDRGFLFANSNFGKNQIQKLETLRGLHVRENKKIDAELEAEELELTEIRKTLDPAEFRILADKFDQKVKRIRNEQASKLSTINTEFNSARSHFFDRTTPIVLELMKERSIEVIFAKESVLISLEQTDITLLAIQRIDEVLRIE